MKLETWLCPALDSADTAECAVVFDQQRRNRILIIPALFDEGNKLRRLTVETMRRIDGAGIDCFLPDLPGSNESLGNLPHQTLESWTGAMLAAANHFRVNRVLAIRGGCLVTPKVIPGWHYAPVKGASLLRQMLRARILADRELGRESSQESLIKDAEAGGLELSGYPLGPAMIRQLQAAAAEIRPNISVIDQDLVGEAGLWLRAEPDESAAQADALAAIIAMAMPQ